MSKDWRLAVCTRWRPLVGTALGVVMLLVSNLLFFGPKLFQILEEGGPLYFWPGYFILCILPTVLALVIFRRWCRRINDSTR